MSPEVERASRTRALRVLLIDDHTLFRTGLQELLGRRGIEVVAATGDGMEGCRLAVELEPDIILLDLRMPNVNGLSVLEQMHDAEIAAPVLARRTQLDQGFDVYRDLKASRSILELIDEKRGGWLGGGQRSAEEITRNGIEFLRESAGRPFLLWLHYFDPHVPRDPPEPFKSQVPASDYHAEVRRADHHVGLVLDELERLGLRERTIVMLTADHGEGLGEHDEGTHSFFVYDTTMRVPLVFWGAAAIPRGRRVASLVRLVDVAPTTVDLLGLPPLENAQGVSLRPLLEDPGADLGLTGYGESIEPTITFGSSLLRFVRVGNWKYIHKLEPELYDVGADPGETRNLAAQHPDVAARLDFTTRELLDKEIFTDSPEGSVREADVVARVETHEGTPELILVHIEIQSRPEKDFPYRMFQYYALLRFKHEVPVFPVAV